MKRCVNLQPFFACQHVSDLFLFLSLGSDISVLWYVFVVVVNSFAFVFVVYSCKFPFRVF